MKTEKEKGESDLIPDLSVMIGKLQLKNPVMVASGIVGYGEEYGELLEFSKLGAIVTKTITLEPRLGNPPPRLAETSCGLLNSIGLQNVGVNLFLTQKMPFLRQIGTRVIVSIGGGTLKEYREVAQKLSNIEGIGALEVNISCPNVKEGGVHFGSDPQTTFRVVSFVRKATTLPLIVKLSPNISAIEPIAKAAVEGGADALSLINTLSGMAIDVETRKTKLGGITGGLSGPAIKPVALAFLWRAAQAVNLPLIGVGGIMEASDALEFIIAGASAIQVGTALFTNPKAPLMILEGIQEYCREKGIRRLKDLVGTLVT